ncbi:solute carrier family 11 [Salpingoeca rosetta]|uniref:Solute carrier family 11 n=1 Tax=Salpingoeca rosetta (strain ATCC 50818 / BSB-021) TaxID=946362 RepID=F2UGU7_SALR5|nr:solute carrier family 11 [Salpingoeca rosetta]EGD75847.1 solute carrier family 11 [Salpingoeca rosetta]|eukprot:XP_004991768.1 solute carrier family 11 [Salpingoeca rosetta]
MCKQQARMTDADDNHGDGWLEWSSEDEGEGGAAGRHAAGQQMQQMQPARQKKEHRRRRKDYAIPGKERLLSGFVRDVAATPPPNDGDDGDADTVSLIAEEENDAVAGMMDNDGDDGNDTGPRDAGLGDAAADAARVPFSFKRLWAFTGPGWLMSIAYLDPGNIESDLQAGAVGGYQLLWALFWATVFGYIFQTLTSRLGVVTGSHLAQMCRKQYSRPVRYALWLMMELAIIGADVQEVIGSAIAIRILSRGKIPLWGGSLITAVDTFTFLFLEQYGFRKLEFVFATLIIVMVCTFGYIYGKSSPNTGELLVSIVVPRLSHKTAVQCVGLIGAVIMPHNLFLHSGLVLHRPINRSSKFQVREANMYYAIESAAALFVSFIVNLFVVGVFATLDTGNDDDATSGGAEINLNTAGDLLGARYGDAVLYIWAVGLLAAGQSSTMTGCYSGQFVMSGFLDLHLSPWRRVLLTRTVAMVPTLLFAVLADENLNGLDEWINVLQSMQLPFALFPLLHFTGSRFIMKSFTSPRWLTALSWLLALIIIGVNYYLIADTIVTVVPASAWYAFLGIGAVLLAYIVFSAYLAVGPYLHYGSMQHIYKPEARLGWYHVHHRINPQSEDAAVITEPMLSSHDAHDDNNGENFRL